MRRFLEHAATAAIAYALAAYTSEQRTAETEAQLADVDQRLYREHRLVDDLEQRTADLEHVATWTHASVGPASRRIQARRQEHA